MKFAKELEEDLVPEWRVKYLNYKVGKKKVKAVARALKNINRTPRQVAGRPVVRSVPSQNGLPFTSFDFNRRATIAAFGGAGALADPDPRDNSENERPGRMRRQSLTMFAKSPPIIVPGSQGEDASMDPERTPLRDIRSEQMERSRMSYGSIVGTPPDDEIPGDMTELELPDPAITPTRTRIRRPGTPSESDAGVSQVPPSPQPVGPSPDPYHIGKANPPPRRDSSLTRRLFKMNAPGGTPGSQPSKPQPSKLRSMFTPHGLDSPDTPDIQLDAYRELDAKQEDFFNFLDKELDKIEDFYKMKELEANDRLHVLRTQLHEMRDQRVQEIQKAKHGESSHHPQEVLDGAGQGAPPKLKEDHNTTGSRVKFLKPVESFFTNTPNVGKTSKAMQKLASPKHPRPKQKADEDRQDYVRRKQDHVPYRFAKRRLKLALQEFYRALELLKNYTILNRTAFRKINKKYDKAVNARPTGRYMTEKVNNAYFVQSNVMEGHLVAVEDLYARYFERGNHKIAVNKLRSKLKPGDQSASSFRNGLFIAAGACFGISGLVKASGVLYDPDPVISTHVSYLLQLYAGYFLALLLFLMFVLDCMVWTNARINYIFVFEYDTRHVLDWRQLAEIPCFFLFLNGLFLWINFQQQPTDSFFLYWPLVLIALTLGIMAIPVPVLYYHSRRWWGFSNFRLLLAGLYPVEFRDFYLGDMYCSETYAMSQIELFFCLYGNGWSDPSQCNSSNSRLLGFFTTLPAIWRALQCLRRYYDSKNWFPHLANFVKYCFNIVYYMSLSIYRIEKSDQNRAIFIAIAAINGLYCSFWDVFMDFSLGDPWSRHPFLRDRLAYRKLWFYYFAIVADVILRHQWILYALFTADVQHSAIMSFGIGLAEVLRRGLWSLFRVENEHCNNVGKFRASRDIPLPYDIPASPEDTKGRSPDYQRRTPGDLTSSTGADLERASTQETSSTMRQRRTPAQTPGLRALQRVGTMIATAHAQDFEKKRRPDVVGGSVEDDEQASSDEDDDEDDDLELHVAPEDLTLAQTTSSQSGNHHSPRSHHSHRSHKDR